MALITTQQRDQLTALYIAMYQATPGVADLSTMVQAVENGATLAEVAAGLAAQPEFASEYPGFMTGEEFADRMIDNLLVSDTPAAAVTWSKDWILGKLNAGESRAEILATAVIALTVGPGITNPNYATARASLVNKVEVSNYYSVTNELDADLASRQAVIANVDGTAASVTAAKAGIDNTVSNQTGEEFDLTTGVDVLDGSNGNDVFTALDTDDSATGGQTLNDADIINGGLGNDRLNATIDSNAAPTIEDVEVIYVRPVATGLTFDLSGVSGASEIWVDRPVPAGGALTFDITGGIDTDDVTFGFNNVDFGATVEIETDGDTLNLASADSEDVLVTGANGASITDVTVNAVSGDNVIELDTTFSAIETVTVSGAGTLELTLDANAVTDVDASENSGGVTIDLTAATALETLMGSSSDDDFTIDAGGADVEVDLGDGDDVLTLVAASFDADDEIAGGDGEDTIAVAGDDVDVLDADVHTGFEVLEITAAATGAIALDNADFDFTDIVLAADLSAAGDLTLTGFENTITVEAGQAGDIVIEDAEDISFTIDDGLAAATTTLANVDLSDVTGTATFASAGATDDYAITVLNVEGLETLVFTGAGDVDITFSTTDSAGDDHTITTLDLSGVTGEFILNSELGSDGVEVLVGNLDDNSSILLDAQDDGDGVARDTLVFGDALDGDIEIGNFQSGVGVTADRLDLSAFGISLDDLELEDDGADTVITSDAFDGSIRLVGVDVNTVSENNFEF